MFQEKFRKFYWPVFLVAAAVASFYAAKHVTFRLKAYAQVTTTPFVAETASYSFEQNPQGDLYFKKVVARRADGSTAEVNQSGPIWSASARRVTFMSGAAIHAFDLVSSKTSIKMKPQELASLKERLTSPPADCLYWGDAKIIDRPILFGQQFVVLQRNYTNPKKPDLNQRGTRWLAPQLGCESLAWRLESRQPDGFYKLQIEERLVSLQMKEPEPAFFDPAANYEEVLPSGIMRRQFQKIGQAQSPQDQQSGARADKYVADHKQ